MTQPTETYIGDGVYASFDGYQIKLRTDRGYSDRDPTNDIIYLDAFVYHNLIKFEREYCIPKGETPIKGK